ncbi:two-component sensor histidine kinase [Planobispora rosea]|uniref:histidine kinase n=1 Tax=Planobispora rosea TaxID=35762 RepID=A0A8J3S772_PLARO|nr:sensor histidine kinase [Planobispora rosea]GGS92709.1 two-component sensor histidine kinase [Planobispora rosea]GIH87231.1 two-component sensor histidine kinase [Planobispora rosea]
MSRRPPPTPADWLIFLAFLLFGVAEELDGVMGSGEYGRPWWWIGVVVIAAVLVLFRQRVPFTALVAYVSINTPLTAYHGDMFAAWQLYVHLLLLFTLLSVFPLEDRRAVAGLSLTAVYAVVVLVTASDLTPGDVAVLLVMISLAGGAGIAVRHHRQVALQAQERGELLAREAVTEERFRIARELHDVVAHSVSVMVMQAGAARLMLRPEQAVEREALNVVEETGREAVEELRLMVGLLRTGPVKDGLAPQPSLARLDELVEQMRLAGLDVRLTVEGDPVPLPAGLNLSAYRIVQEALTNTLRHAGPTTSEVRISYRSRMLCLDIVDEGPRDGRVPGMNGTGHGLVGMRERVALFHGRLSAGPRPGGGYGVSVSLPIAGRITVVT